jgi:hypothetical protein
VGYCLDDLPPNNPPPYQIAILAPKFGVISAPLESLTQTQYLPIQPAQATQPTNPAQPAQIAQPVQQSRPSQPPAYQPRAANEEIRQGSNPFKSFFKKYFFQGQVCLKFSFTHTLLIYRFPLGNIKVKVEHYFFFMFSPPKIN